MRSGAKGPPDNNPEEKLTTPARKTKGAGKGGGGGGASDNAKTENPSPASKDAKKTDVPEVEESVVPTVKAVPPSPKIYIRKVRGKGKNS